MSKLILGLVAGAVLGCLDGLSAWFTPEVRDQMLSIVIGSTFKGLLTGLAAGWVAKKWNSMTAAVLALGIAGLTVGRLSPATSGSAAMLFGLGIDGIALLYMRYLEEREAGALPDVEVVDLRDRTGHAVGQLCFDGPQVHALLLQGVALGKEELERVDADEARCHASIEAVPAAAWLRGPSRG